MVIYELKKTINDVSYIYLPFLVLSCEYVGV